MCHPQPTSGGTGVDEDFGSLQVAASPVGLLLQDISLDCETSRFARIHYFKPCDGWPREQVMVCMYVPLKSFFSFSFL